jgi:hypothetical protein
LEIDIRNDIMNFTFPEKKKILVILPAIAALFIALIPTLKYQWPLGWDIIYHVQYAHVYATYGFTLTDPLLNAPSGQQMGYPPLFHLLIAGLGTVFGVDFFQVARFLQPVMAASLVLSVSYVAYRFYGEIAGASAGFLMLSSYLVGRMVLPLPENLALIFIPLAVYFYYSSIKNRDIKPALLGGVFFCLVVLTHQPATLCLSLIIIGITLLELIVYRNIRVLKNLLSFFTALIVLIVLGVVALQIIAPQILQGLSGQILLLLSKSSSLVANRPLSLWGYFGNLGFLVIIFSVIGGVVALKKHGRKDLLMLVWVIAMILLSNSYWFGISVISYRVIIYLLIPLSMLGGLGITFIINSLEDYQNKLQESSGNNAEINVSTEGTNLNVIEINSGDLNDSDNVGNYDNLKNKSSNGKIIKYPVKKYPIISYPQFGVVFLIIIYLVCAVSGVLTVTNPKVTNFGVKNEYGTVQISPPSQSEVDLANWFKENGNTSRSMLISNQFAGMFVSTVSGMPMHYDFDYFSIKGLPLSERQKESIGYVVFDKRLVLSPQDNEFILKKVDSEFYPLYYSTVDIPSYIDQIMPDNSHKAYENQDFIVFQMDY